MGREDCCFEEELGIIDWRTGIMSLSFISRCCSESQASSLLNSFLREGLMRRIWKTSSKRFLLITFFAFLTVFGSLISPSYGEDLRNLRYGVSILGGAGDAWHDTPDLTTYAFLPRVDLPLHKNWDLEFEGNYSYWSIPKEHDFYFLGVDTNILFKPIQGSWGSLFLLVGGGLGYNSAGKKVPQIGDSHCGAILQAGVGVYYNLGERWALRVEYRFYHTSDPFRSDRGLNAHAALLGVSF
jgi:hypothetical protein